MINLQAVTEIPSSIKTICFAKTQMFLSRVRDFNTRWSVNIEVQKSAKWAIGTYEKIKHAATKLMFPQWFTKHGANKAHKLKGYQPWAFENLTQAFEKLDSSLRILRMSKTTFHGEIAENEGIEWVNKFNLALAKYNQYEGISISITDLSYFARTNTSGGRSYKALFPVFDKDMNMYRQLGVEHYGEGYFEEIQRSNNQESPNDWYVNIIIQLKDLMIDYIEIENGKQTVLHRFPYGDLLVGFSLSLATLFKMNNLDANVHSFNSVLGTSLKDIHQHTYQFPHRSAIRHPYVKGNRSENQTSSPRRQDFNTYDLGNTCFGDFKFDILSALGKCQFGIMKGLLQTWATSFPYRTQNPLAGTSYWVFGRQPETKDLNRLSIDPSLCERELRNLNRKNREVFQEEYCTNCLVEDCSVKYQYFSTVLSNLLSDEQSARLGIYEEHFRHCISSRFRQSYDMACFMRDFEIGHCRGADYKSSYMLIFFNQIDQNKDMDTLIDWYLEGFEIASRWWYLNNLSGYEDAYREHRDDWDNSSNPNYNRKSSVKLLRQLRALRLVQTTSNPHSQYDNIKTYEEHLMSSSDEFHRLASLDPEEEVSF